MAAADEVDELCDLGGDCVHPVDRRDYDANMNDPELLEWFVRCGECGAVLAQGLDTV